MKKFTRSANRGLTLIELVVVIAILAVLGGLVVPRLDFLKGQADAAAGANTAADLATMIQTYKASTGSYPALDTLTNGSNLISGIWNDNGNVPNVGFTATTLDFQANPNLMNSFIEGGLMYGIPNTGTSSQGISYSDMGVAVQSLLASYPNLTVAVPNATGGGGYSGDLYTTLFPTYVAQTSGTGTQSGTVLTPGTAGYDSTSGVLKNADGSVNGYLIGMGVGPANQMVGKVMTNTPLDTQGDSPSTIYCRYFALFAVYTSGSPAELKAVVDHRMKSIDTRIQQYNNAANL